MAQERGGYKVFVGPYLRKFDSESIQKLQKLWLRCLERKRISHTYECP